ncbi:MAG TPA: putative DNA modification/repair radical SAM protein [Candidatus Hydrogenedentes bacterium]|nr:putative DNA modification/repair radical SAM protein [Candidatus Hydrogenedentota bacterium]HPG69286.1 putative DNA modification/repair radical SAM protein [Candidatus Hydrogenedentota bacterium]
MGALATAFSCNSTVRVGKAPDATGKFAVLTEAAKYDVSCASSGSNAQRKGARTGNCSLGGICHSWSADGRCISLLKVLFSNDCIFDCAFCVNRRSNDIPRATFTVEEMVDITLNFYTRNYIEGLFLSSAIFGSPNRTMESLVRVAEELRTVHGFGGYLHVKAIPGADPVLIARAGRLADRLSVNIELPTERSLNLLAPQKRKELILNPMRQIGQAVAESIDERKRYRSAPVFAPAGQSTQLVIGASPERDCQILRLSESLYDRFGLKRVYYSAYVPVNDDSRLPATLPPMQREHRLYQADWLLRFYGFHVDELLDDAHPDIEEALDPKTSWALRHPERFPVEVNRADYEALLRVPGIGVRSAQRIVAARRFSRLDVDALRRIGVVMKRARFFITCGGRYVAGRRWDPVQARRDILAGIADAPKQLELALPL